MAPINIRGRFWCPLDRDVWTVEEYDAGTMFKELLWIKGDQWNLKTHDDVVYFKIVDHETLPDWQYGDNRINPNPQHSTVLQHPDGSYHPDPTATSPPRSAGDRRRMTSGVGGGLYYGPAKDYYTGTNVVFFSGIWTVQQFNMSK